MLKQIIAVMLLPLVMLGISINCLAASPNGSVILLSTELVNVKSVRCGFIKGKWTPGSVVPGGYFLSRSTNIKNLKTQAKKAKAKKRAALLRKILVLTQKRTAEVKVCNRVKKPIPTPTPINHAIRFNFAGAVGLTLSNSSATNLPFATALGAAATTEPASNMDVVDSNGQTREVLSSGTATISKFLIAPNDKLYVLFSQKINLNDSSSNSGNCLLAEVSTDSGEPICVDPDVEAIQWGTDPIQFDSSGAIYYLASGGQGVRLRKYLNGTIKDLINDNIFISDFVVLDDGRVIISGQTKSTGTHWVRRVNSLGGLSSLAGTSNANFLKKFPDGNVYMGIWGEPFFGVIRYLSGSDMMDPREWISGSNNGSNPNPYFDANTICTPENSVEALGFCAWYGTYIRGFFRTLDNKVFVISGDTSARSTLMQYYPTLERPSTVVKAVTAAQGVLGNLILAGLDSASTNVMTIFNTTNSSEVQLIGASNEIEVYHINYVVASNIIMFDGLRFSDNKYVLGQVDLNTMQVTSSPTGGAKLIDFQTFH